jgi:tRNA dimethylallyltransferase
MFESGLVDEVRGLLAAGVSPQARPLQAIGYRQAQAVVLHGLPVDDAVRETVTATLQYAKRQRTWFRHQAAGQWFANGETLSAAARAFLSP